MPYNYFSKMVLGKTHKIAAFGRYPWTGPQYKIPFLITHITAALSIFGSAWILFEIMFDRKKREMSYYRLLFGLSFFDLLSSFWYFIGGWAQPFDLKSKVDGFGTVATCNMSGYFIYLGSLAIPSYNAALCMYLYLTICHGWQEQRMKKDFERYVHMLIGPIAFIIALLPVFLELYHPWYFYCFVTTTAGAVKNWDTHFVPSEIFKLLYYAGVIICSAIIATTMVSVITHAKRTIQKSERHTFRSQHDQSDSNKSFSLRSMILCRTRTSRIVQEATTRRVSVSRRERRRKSKLALVIQTAVLYAIPFFLTWLLPALYFMFVHCFVYHKASAMVVTRNPTTALIMNIYLSIFVPLQGFFNWLIFMRPRLKRSSACAIAASASSSCSLIGAFLSLILCPCRTESSEDCCVEDSGEFEEGENIADSLQPVIDEEKGMIDYQKTEDDDEYGEGNKTAESATGNKDNGEYEEKRGT
mmetsp:Transcript_16926/g.25055  ORF Transcript_16926/g.25055 Transcript_16926/m.25055 type:complete len:471 (+) Transcript_16926:54-1466(+)